MKSHWWYCDVSRPATKAVHLGADHACDSVEGVPAGVCMKGRGFLSEKPAERSPV